MQEAWEKHAEALQELQIEETHKMRPEIARVVEERVQKLLERDAEPLDVSKYKEPVMYYESPAASGGLPAAKCTCGWSKHHMRLNVLKRAAEKHYNKTGHKPT